MKLLVTGASGNIGRPLVAMLAAEGHRVHAGTRGGTYDAGGTATPVAVDFERGPGPAEPFDAIFLLRPPQIADPAVFARFLDPVPRDTRIVFLSVQGAESRAYLPHARIEKTILRLGFDPVFVRPVYFMDNLLTTLWPELQARGRIYLPAGALRLDWVSVRDVARVSAAALTGRVADRAVTVCSGERLGFAEACAIVNAAAGTTLSYEPAGVAAFVRHARRQGQPWSFVAVMLLLHTLPRLRPPSRPDCSRTAEILGRAPESLADFATRNRARFADLA